MLQKGAMLFYLSVLNEFLGSGVILHAVTTTIAANYENNMLDAAFDGNLKICISRDLCIKFIIILVQGIFAMCIT
jgi:hypothetical protein